MPSFLFTELGKLPSWFLVMPKESFTFSGRTSTAYILHNPFSRIDVLCTYINYLDLLSFVKSLLKGVLSILFSIFILYGS